MCVCVCVCVCFFLRFFFNGSTGFSFEVSAGAGVPGAQQPGGDLLQRRHGRRLLRRPRAHRQVRGSGHDSELGIFLFSFVPEEEDLG